MKLKALGEALRRSSEGEGNKALWRQVFELIVLMLRSRLGPGFYYLARLDSRDVPWSVVTGFASVKAYNRAVHRVNDATFYRASQHKAIEKAVLSTYGLPTPELIAYADPLRGRATDGAAMTTPEAVAQLLDRVAADEEVCFKQAHGWGGEGFRAARIGSAGELVDLATNEVRNTTNYLQELFDSSPEGFVIERFVAQHEFYSKLNPTSINSFRILIHDSPDVESSWIYAFLRVGRSGALVDNATSGAIIFPVDPVAKCLQTGFVKYGPRITYAVHPDSGVELSGVRPPDFDAAVSLALDAVRAFPGITFAGVDVAMAADGPRILELNVWPDYAGFAYCQVPSRPSFTARV